MLKSIFELLNNPIVLTFMNESFTLNECFSVMPLWHATQGFTSAFKLNDNLSVNVYVISVSILLEMSCQSTNCS